MVAILSMGGRKLEKLKISHRIQAPFSSSFSGNLSRGDFEIFYPFRSEFEGAMNLNGKLVFPMLPF